MSSKIRTLIPIALLVFAFPALTACDRSSEGKSDAVLCRLAYTSKGYYAPQILAYNKGWLAADGVIVQEIKLGMGAGIAAAEALVSGSADVAVMGDVPALIALASARDCVLVAAYGGGEKMHSIIVGERSGIEKPADLAGKSLGVQFGSSTHGAVYLYLEHHGIDPAKVQLVNLPQKDLVEALISGSIDALAASEPTPMLTRDKVPGARELACLSGLGNDYPSLIVASQEFADAHPEAIRAIVAGTRRAVDWINADPDAAAAETALVTGTPASLEAAMFRKMEWRVRLDEQVVRSLNMTGAFLHRLGKLKEVPDVKGLSRPEFLEP
ncbi:MAG: ABC transporter substrate-binding protein [Syntrophotaleaceae bacterium]